MSDGRPILFLSDYGLADEFVGVCHVVMARIAPGCRVVDLAHEIPPQDVARGAAVLAGAARYAPEEAVLLAIVDPGVGTERRAVVVEAGGRLLVGPDNGVLSPAWEALGGASGAFEIASRRVMLEPVSATFQGRDIFAPAAAHLAAGLPPEEVGPPVDPGDLHRVVFPGVRIEPGHLHCKVIGIDRFGNVQLSARPADLESAELAGEGQLRVRAAGRGFTIPRGRTFAEVGEGECVVFVDSAGMLALAVNRGRAAQLLGLASGDHVVLAAPIGPE